MQQSSFNSRRPLVSRRSRLLAGLALLAILLASLIAHPGMAQTPNWDAPFRTPLYLLHVSESSSQYGPVQRDDYILHPALPDENGTVLVADGYGGVYINTAELFGGPFTTARQVCEAVQGLPKNKLHVDIMGMQCDYMVADCSAVCEDQDSDKTWDGVAEHPPCTCICKTGFHAWEDDTGWLHCTQCWQYCLESTNDGLTVVDEAASTPGRCACVCEEGYALGPSGKCEESAAPAPLPEAATYSPSITLSPEEGGGGSEIEVSGTGFPPDTLVEVRWESRDGVLVGEGQSDGSGRLQTPMFVPADAVEGEHVVVSAYSDGGQQRTVSTRFFVRELCFEGKVWVRMRDGWPLQDVEVSLWWSDPALPHAPVPVPDSVLGPVVPAGPDGSYRICSPRIAIPSRNWLLAVGLREARTGSFDVIDQSTGGLAEGLFGTGGRIGANPDDPATWLAVESEADLRQDLWFEDLEDKVETPAVREDHGLDTALVYYHVHQGLRVYGGLGASLGAGPLPVFVFDPEGTRADGSGIYMGAADSEWNSGNAPKNREWHELSHYAMLVAYGGRFPPLHREAGGIEGDVNGNHIVDKDTNHGGYLANALSSSDAITEGFAEFMAMVIAAEMAQRGEPYMQDLLAPYVYTVSDGTQAPQLYNMELNHPQNLLSFLSQERRTAFYDDLKDLRSLPVPQRSIWPFLSDEEECVASLLWDLYDQPGEADRDALQVPLPTLWQILLGTYTFPSYYPGTVITSFLGDADVYEGQWQYHNPSQELGSYQGERRRNSPFPTQVRHIYYLKDLYDALAISLPGQQQAVQRSFAGHKITLDTYRVFENYTQPDAPILRTFGDAGSKAEVSVSAEAGYDAWSQGLVADLTVSGWGSGFTISHSQATDARGWLYLWMWMNAPLDSTFSVVLEDDAGQWLCPGSSQALYELESTPQDWEMFQRGTGRWSAYSREYSTGSPYPYVAVIAPTFEAYDRSWAHAYECLPNPKYLTPPASRTDPNLQDLRGIGVLFTSPGSYRVMVGAMVLTLDYPWKAGMRTLYGLGDPAQGMWLPYRRDHPFLAGGKALVEVGQVPATVWVSNEYGAPYEDLSFRYPVEVTQSPVEIGLYIEPSFEGAGNTVRLWAQVGDGAPGEAVAITSEEYWARLGESEYLIEPSLAVRRGPRWAVWGGIGLGAFLLVGAGGGAAWWLAGRRRRRARPPVEQAGGLDDYSPWGEAEAGPQPGPYPWEGEPDAGRPGPSWDGGETSSQGGTPPWDGTGVEAPTDPYE